jgi:hypothetical protein
MPGLLSQLAHSKRNGYLLVESDRNERRIGYGPRVQAIPKRWNIVLPAAVTESEDRATATA